MAKNAYSRIPTDRHGCNGIPFRLRADCTRQSTTRNVRESLSRISSTCRLANADEFIATFPKGYDTYLEQGGANVSGGQKQRLCIARALLKKPKILILDDSTSAVDTKTDAGIRAALKTYLPETTKFIIAQRISSLQDSDLILVLDGGVINGMGTHEELLQTNAIYQEIYASQMKGGNSDGIENEEC